jgi:ribosomal protein S18 acetylase RimI-like enzyme
MSDEQIHFLEELAANAWPAEIIQVVDGWRLRYTSDVHRRVNSAWPNDDNGRSSLSTKLTLVEAFYQRHNAPARYQISPAAQPAPLDDVLAERGYVIDAPTNVQTADIAPILQHTSAIYPATINSNFDEAWFAFDVQAAQRSAHVTNVRRGIMQRIGPQAAYVSIQLDEQIVGIGLGVVERGWLGVFGMRTHGEYRRRGVATAVLHHLTQWGQSQGATHAYLQVEQDNPKAQRLYEKVGFQTLYAYHYRQKAL